MAFVVLYHSAVKETDLPLLDSKTKSRLKNEIESRLITAPHQFGEPLRRNLKGYWKLRVGDYRVVFKISGVEVLVLAIIHRKDVYEKILKRV
ncbi:type II toxin-antitoxin system RelE/ParE family toxin [bacterium]|nr:MAG: type II toxin-antitoxin system RelE/ParE family toxin [bacterium]